MRYVHGWPLPKYFSLPTQEGRRPPLVFERSDRRSAARCAGPQTENNLEDAFVNLLVATEGESN